MMMMMMMGACRRYVSLVIGIVPDPVETRPSPTRYHTEFGLSRSISMGVGSGSQNMGMLGPHDPTPLEWGRG